MGLLLAVFGGFFALLFILNNFFQTARGKARLGFIGTSLAFITVGVSLWGLIENQSGATPQSLINRIIIAIAAAVILTGLLILIFEFRRSPRNLIQSRGILGMGIGILLLVSMFTVPFLSAYFYVLPDTPAISAVSSPTPLANSTQSADSALQEQFTRFFRNIFQIVGETTGLDNQQMVNELNQDGMTVAKLIENNEGDMDEVVKDVIDLTRVQIQTLMSEGQVNRLQGALILSNLEFFIRTAISRPIEPDRLDDLSNLLMATEAPTLTEEFTITPAPTLTNTPTPTLTRTPRPSPSATATRERFATRTPTLTPTLPNPCLALVDYNLNVRAAPNFESEVLMVIPFNSTITLFARSQDSAWWLTTYEGQEGWVSREFIRVSDSCAELPIR